MLHESTTPLVIGKNRITLKFRIWVQTGVNSNKLILSFKFSLDNRFSNTYFKEENDS